MQISDKGIALIKEFEGCRLRAYPDPKTGDKPWTIGYGWTGCVDGKPVTPHTVIAQETADRLLRSSLVSYEQDVLRLVKVEVAQHQFDALVSFVYNVGARVFSTSTLLKKLNGGDYTGAADEFLRWVSPGTKVEAGLRRRRKAERELFLSKPTENA